MVWVDAWKEEIDYKFFYEVRDMQLSGGYKYPGGIICIILSVIAILVTVFLYCYKDLSAGGGLSLFFNLEGTVLLASSLTPVGLTPPPKGLVQKIKWFFKQERGIPLGYNQPMLYAGLLSLALAAIISAN